MHNKPLKEIVKMSLPDLNFITDNWEDYDKDSVLLAYSELKKRGLNLAPKRKKLKEFCLNNNSSEIELLLEEFFKGHGYKSYEEYRKSGISEEKTLPPEEKISDRELQEQILETLKLNQKDNEIIKKWVVFWSWFTIIATIIYVITLIAIFD